MIVAADGTDGTREAARELAASDRRRDHRIQVIGTPERRGKGLAVREGVRLATGDVIGFVDADNKTPISEFEKIEAGLIDGYDVVIGSRSLADSQIERTPALVPACGFEEAMRLSSTHASVLTTSSIHSADSSSSRETWLETFSTPDDRRLHVRCRDPVHRAAARIPHRPGAGSLER